jgi:molybdopterin molybdotransferase
MNIPASYGGILPDSKDILTGKLAEAFGKYQVVLLTGGVSVGDYDLVPEVLEELDFKILVESTAIKPGKPMVFARKGNRYCFGLSGNPVSSLVQFELYVKPFLYAIMGYNYQPLVFKLPLGKNINLGKTDRQNFVPANITAEMEVVPVEFHGSAHIHALGEASYLLGNR